MENKVIRGWIVRIMQRAYPAGLEADVLHRQLNGLGYKITRRELIANLAYLAEDNFIEELIYGDEWGDNLTNKIYKLTTRGVDIAEGSIKDEGVQV